MGCHESRAVLQPRTRIKQDQGPVISIFRLKRLIQWWLAGWHQWDNAFGEIMNEEDAGSKFGEILHSEVAPIECKRCGSKTIVNKVYLPYLDGGLESCKQCRSKA